VANPQQFVLKFGDIFKISLVTNWKTY